MQVADSRSTTKGRPWGPPLREIDELGSDELGNDDRYRRTRAGALPSLRPASTTADAPRARTRPMPTRAMARAGEPSDSFDMLTITERRAGAVAAAAGSGVATGAGAASGAGAAAGTGSAATGAGAMAGAGARAGTGARGAVGATRTLGAGAGDAAGVAAAAGAGSAAGAGAGSVTAGALSGVP